MIRSFFPKRYFHRKRASETFMSRKIGNMIMSSRLPLMGGSHKEREGRAFGQSGRRCPWSWEREIRKGYWAGQRRRVRWQDED